MASYLDRHMIARGPSSSFFPLFFILRARETCASDIWCVELVRLEYLGTYVVDQIRVRGSKRERERCGFHAVPVTEIELLKVAENTSHLM
jgi:hypothetical protein